MPSLYVCPLSRLDETIAASGARHLVTLATLGSPVARPAAIRPEHHLRVGFSDIVAPMEGHRLPDETHVRAVLDFAAAWDRTRPLVLHCYAGISRSTAAAYAVACALAPERDEAALAQDLRRLSPSATPNRLFVALADRLLDRQGRMSAGITAIGRGAEAYEGSPFRLALT
ncbi:tyrosine phosphatase family protein [Methylobacterium sp. Leaf118]|uniref:tyrosine phosphatase family protein n=1 Tax=Methylobacterium sp. Leaf118 TaxID=2876562 RepID=UPI001E3C8F3E|nr:protein tyrosine phosphatase [Methylobacterium sp. Leaf118]